MAEPVSAIIHLVHFSYSTNSPIYLGIALEVPSQLTRLGTVRYIQEFSRGVVDQDNRVHELRERIQRHAETVETVLAVYERIRCRQDKDVRRAARHLLRRVETSRGVMERLTRITGRWDDGELTIFRRVVLYWCYEQEGRAEIERNLSLIADLLASFQLEIAAASL
jgi:hypothetical protein